jgi:signal transduction histidine kinase
MRRPGQPAGSSMGGVLSYFRDTFVFPAGRETLRAFLIFGILLVALVGIGGELAFRDLSLSMLRERTGVGRNAAQAIAEDVARLAGADGGEGIDRGRLRTNRRQLESLIRSRIAESRFIHYVELSDRSGGRLLFVARPGVEPPSLSKAPGRLPALSRDSIQVPIATGPEGGVRLGIAKGALEDELIELRRSLWLKIGVAGAIALGLLGLGLFYVLYLIRKNRDLERAQQSAARASYVGVLASRLAHEIRNPLNAMNMNLQMLEEELHAQAETTDPEHFELLESTKSEVKRLASLVNNFLTYARPPQARLKSRDLNVLARELVRLLEADFRQYGVRLVVDLEPLLPHVETDETQLKQAVINLLVNARQILGEGGVVTLKTRAGSKGEVVIEVEDNGPGVPAEVRERIFEVFYSSRGGGTGLGLPIAKQIVERHGGEIEVDSVEGQGTTFRIRLPRSQRRIEPSEGAESER